MVGDAVAVGAQSDAVRTALTPAGYAFSIWGPIFLAALLYAAWQLRADDPRPVSAGPWVATAFWGCATWQILVPVGGFGWGAQIVLGAIALSATVAARALATPPRREGRPGWLIAVPLATLAGWTVAASCVGLSATLVDSGAVSQVRLSGGWPVVALLALAAGLGAAAVVAVRGHPLTLAALVWALVAIGVGNGGNPAWGALEQGALWAAGGLLLAVTLLALRRKR